MTTKNEWQQYSVISCQCVIPYSCSVVYPSKTPLPQPPKALCKFRNDKGTVVSNLSFKSEINEY